MSSLNDIEWSERRPMPRAQGGGAAAYLNGELVIAGGTNWSGDVKTWLTDVQIYNPSMNTWRLGPPLPGPLGYGAFVSSGTELEILGGGDGQTSQRASWKLDSAKTKWVSSGTLPADTLLGRAARVGGSVYLFGGCRDAADLKTCSDAVWQRNATGKWQRVSSIPAGPLALPALAATNSSVYLFGGCTLDAQGKVVNHTTALRYDPSSNQWKTLRDLPAANRGPSAVAYGDWSILLFGGYTDSGFTSEVLLYDIPSNTYRKLKSMPVPMLGIEFVVNGRTVYGAGGEDRMRSRSARVFEGKLTEIAK